MRTDELKIEIGKLGLSDKLLLVEGVWDEIAESNKQLPLPEWQERELKKDSLCMTREKPKPATGMRFTKR